MHTPHVSNSWVSYGFLWDCRTACTMGVWSIVGGVSSMTFTLHDVSISTGSEEDDAWWQNTGDYWITAEHQRSHAPCIHYISFIWALNWNLVNIHFVLSHSVIICSWNDLTYFMTAELLWGVEICDLWSDICYSYGKSSWYYNNIWIINSYRSYRWVNARKCNSIANAL